MPLESARRGEISRQWTSRSIGSRLQHNIFYWLIRHGGRRAAYALLYPVVGWYVLLSPWARARCAPYLSRRFPGRAGPARLLDCWRMILALGKALVDRAVVGILGPGQIHAELRGKEELLGLLGEGKGLILVMSHVGCWQAGMSALAYLNRPVSLLMQKEEGDIDRQWYEHAGLPSPYRIIDPRGFLGGAVEMVDVLRRGEVLSVMGDRIFGNPQNSIRVPFLGQEAFFPLGPCRVAAATGAPLAVLFSVKTGPAAYELLMAGAIRVPEAAGKTDEGLAPCAARFVGLLEAYTREHPYQFFNFFDMWSQNQLEREP